MCFCVCDVYVFVRVCACVQDRLRMWGFAMVEGAASRGSGRASPLACDVSFAGVAVCVAVCVAVRVAGCVAEGVAEDVAEGGAVCVAVCVAECVAVVCG